VPELFPFPGLRYQRAALDADLGAVAAPPYDVIDEEDRAQLEAAHPQNAVRLILPRDVEPGDRYEQARAAFEQWRAEGILAADGEPHLYVYRMVFTDEDGQPRRMIGVVGALELAALGEGVYAHEKTLAKAKSDRLDLLRATRANFDPVWGLSLAPGLSEVLESLASGDPAAAVDADGVEHCIFPASGDAVDRIRAMIAAEPMVIADGHHRYETALAYQQERREAGIDDPGADRIMMLVVELADDQLMVRPIHRLLRNVHHEFRGKLNFTCTVSPMGPNTPDGVRHLLGEMDRTESMGLVDGPGLALLTPKLDILQLGLEQLPEPLRDVDATRFVVMMGRMSMSIELPEIDYRHDALHVAEMVAKGAADAAILLRPATIDQIAMVAAAGLRMPQKTTFFQPKPLTGLVFRSLDLG